MAVNNFSNNPYMKKLYEQAMPTGAQYLAAGSQSEQAPQEEGFWSSITPSFLQSDSAPANTAPTPAEGDDGTDWMDTVKKVLSHPDFADALLGFGSGMTKGASSGSFANALSQGFGGMSDALLKNSAIDREANKEISKVMAKQKIDAAENARKSKVYSSTLNEYKPYLPQHLQEQALLVAKSGDPTLQENLLKEIQSYEYRTPTQPTYVPTTDAQGNPIMVNSHNPTEILPINGATGGTPGGATGGTPGGVTGGVTQNTGSVANGITRSSISNKISSIGAVETPTSDKNTTNITNSGPAPIINTSFLPGENKVQYEARQRFELAQLDAYNNRVDAANTKRTNAEEGEAKFKRDIKLANINTQIPIMSELASKQTNIFNTIHLYDKMIELQKNSQSGKISGSAVASAIRNVLGDEDFQRIRSMTKEAALSALGGKLGAQVSDSDREFILSTIQNPENEQSVNIENFRRSKMKNIEDLKNNERTVALFEKDYGIKIPGRNLNASYYLNYPTYVTINGKQEQVEDYDPQSNQIMIKGVVYRKKGQ